MLKIEHTNTPDHLHFPIKIKARMTEIWIDEQELEQIAKYYEQKKKDTDKTN